MKTIIKVFLANIVLYIIFACIYVKIKDQFQHNNNNKIVTTMDCFLFSSSVQAGCGFTYITPTTNLCKTITMTQTLLLITTNIIPVIIYFA
jgi:hypothetical protein